MKLARSLLCVLAAAAVLGVSAQLRASLDVAADRRNSFPAADQRTLRTLREPLIVTVHLAPEDPRYVDLRRNVLTKLERALPNVTVRLAGGRQSVVGNSSEESYGVVDYDYRGRRASTRSTSHREVLPLLYGLADVPVPAPATGEDYPGYPLVADADASLAWFLFGLPLLIAPVWWWSRQPPGFRLTVKKDGDQP